MREGIFDDIFDAFEESSVFAEYPVDIDMFLHDSEYLNHPEIKLSTYQRQAILALTQIYREDTLREYMHPDLAAARFRQTCKEVVLKLGKGSGKDLLSVIACTYLVYLLLCLKDPAAYFGKPSGDAIDIINIAVNAAQANNVFFKNLVKFVKGSPWFQDRYDSKYGGEPAQRGQINFDKNITVYSGHSEREAWEGYNVIMVVLDEISAFGEESETNSQANTAEATYKMYRASVDSRFPDFGKVALLSFPRYKADFISRRYDELVAEKEVVVRTHTFKLDPDLADGLEGNEFTIDWDEDHIVRYTYPKVWALSRPTWEVNPTKNIEDYTMSFHSDPVDALTRFACMPPQAVDAFFKDHDKIEAAFAQANGITEDGVFAASFQPDEGKEYFVHVDLSKKIDRCAVAIAHVDRWAVKKLPGTTLTEPQPYVTVDAVRWWTPTADKNIDFEEVRTFIVSLAQRGFNLKRVTFDRWRSDDMIQYLNSVGIKAEVLSVAKMHYIDFATVMMDDRLKGPDIEILKEELKYLKVMKNDKIDHERKRTKDLSDATCGAIFNAISLTERPYDQEFEVITIDTFRKKKSAPPMPDTQNPRKAEGPMPSALAAFLAARKI